MNNFYSDVFVSVYQFISMDQIPNCGLVCRGWRAHEGKVWEKRAKGLFGNELNVPDFKTFLQQHFLRSNDDIVNRFQEFMGRLQRGENARFRVVFGPRGQTLDVVIKTDHQPLNADGHVLANHTNFDFTENYVAFNGLGNGSITRPQALYRPTTFRLVGTPNLQFTARVPCVGTAAASIFTDQSSGLAGTVTPLSTAIENIVTRRLDEFDNPRRCRQSMVSLAIVIALLASLIVLKQNL